MVFNPQHYRPDFPQLTRMIEGKPVVYLDSAATSLKPQSVLNAELEYYSSFSANIHRGIYALSEEATTAYEGVRSRVANYLDAASDEVIFTRGTTESINAIASSLSKTWAHDEDIISTIVEHHANFVPWQQLCIEKNVHFLVAPYHADGGIDFQWIVDHVTNKTRVVAFTAKSNVLGVPMDVATWVRAIKKKNKDTIVVVDAAQWVPHQSLSVKDWGADVIAFSAHKMLGPTGVGVLWAKRSLLEELSPYQFGGDMIRDVSLKQSSFAEIPHKFEAGTPNIAGVIGFGAAIKYWQSLSEKHYHSYESALTRHAVEKLLAVASIHLVAEPSLKRQGIITFTSTIVHPHDISQFLADSGICVRAGHHCAMPLHTHLGLPGSVRASFHVYTTEEEVDRFINAVAECVRIFKR